MDKVFGFSALLATVGKAVSECTIGQCNKDMDCETRCCDIDTQYYECGKCTEIEDWPRCETRKKNHRIALYVLLGLTIITIMICWY